MANDLRQAILVQLASGPLDVGSLAGKLDVGVVWISQNLKRLLDEEVVQVQPLGQRRIYSLGSRVRANYHKGKVDLELATSDGASLVITLPRKPRMLRKVGKPRKPQRPPKTRRVGSSRRTRKPKSS